MSAEPQFLSFKGLKQYLPEAGWNTVHTPSSPPMQPMAAQTPPPPEDVPTLTETPEDQDADSATMSDPLMHELFDQLKVAPTDELTQTWRTIAAEVDLLTQRMAQHRELTERIAKLDQDMAEQRNNILTHLNDVQHAADQQLASARLRAEVSALAQSKLAARLNTSR